MDRAEPRAYHRLDELILWQMELGEVPLEDALYSAGGFFVAPDGFLLASPDHLFAAVGRPAQMVACDRFSGRELWRASADACHGLARGHDLVVWLTQDDLSAHNPFDGELLWSLPVDSSTACRPLLEVAHGRVFVGSKNGRLHALSASTGHQLWNQQVVPPHAFPEGYLDIGDGQRLWLESSPEPSIIETRPAILEDRIIVGTYARSVVSYFIESGRRAWQWQIDGPALGAVLPYGANVVLHTKNRVYCLRSWDGWVLWQRDFPEEEIAESFVCTENLVYLIARRSNDYGHPQHDAEAFGAPTILGMDDNGIRLRRSTVSDAMSLYSDATTGWLYQLTEASLSILDPENGERLHQVQLHPSEHHLAMAVMPEAIYLLTQSFSNSVRTSVVAFRHP